MIFDDIIFEKVNQPHKMATEYRVTVVLLNGQRVYCGNIVAHEALHHDDFVLTHLKETITYEITQLIMDKLQTQIYTSIDSMEKLSKNAMSTTKSLSDLIGWGKIDFKSEDDVYFVSENKPKMIAYDKEDDGSVTITQEEAPTPDPAPYASMNELEQSYHENKKKILEQSEEYDTFHSGGTLPKKPVKKGSIDYSSSPIVKELQKIFPNITQKVKHPVTKKQERLNNVIVNLNDSHKWSREQIADWIETLSLDLNAQEYDATMEIVSKTPAHVSHNPGKNTVQVQKGEFVVEFEFNSENYNEKVKDALEELNNLIIEKGKENE